MVVKMVQCVTEFMEEHNIKVKKHPLYNQDLASCDFCLFPALKKASKDDNFVQIENFWRQHKPSLTICQSPNFLKLSRKNGQNQSLLEYKAMNVERQCRIFVKPWSDSILIALWRNDGLLDSFYNFSNSNRFRENLIRTKFILHKIFFRMSILSCSKTLCMFFNLQSKMILLDFQLIIIITVTIRSQFWSNFHEIHMVGASPHMDEPYFFF